jgi:hypothetical protein
MSDSFRFRTRRSERGSRADPGWRIRLEPIREDALHSQGLGWRGALFRGFRSDSTALP